MALTPGLECDQPMVGVRFIDSEISHSFSSPDAGDGGQEPGHHPLSRRLIRDRTNVLDYQSASTAMASMTSSERIGSTRISSPIEPSSLNTVTLGVTALTPPSVYVPGPVTPS